MKTLRKSMDSLKHLSEIHVQRKFEGLFINFWDAQNEHVDPNIHRTPSRVRSNHSVVVFSQITKHIVQFLKNKERRVQLFPSGGR